LRKEKETSNFTERALALGADELVARCEWAFRSRPQELRALRKRYRAFCTDLLLELERTLEVETSPGHKQLWFTQPTGVTTKCTAGVLAPELDTRGDLGYVIGPGSIHHQTGPRCPRSFFRLPEEQDPLLGLAQEGQRKALELVRSESVQP
jgi:hypothetical protein